MSKIYTVVFFKLHIVEKKLQTQMINLYGFSFKKLLTECTKSIHLCDSTKWYVAEKWLM
jgi:hypothetical protein